MAIYRELNINQKISLKGIIMNKRDRDFLNHRTVNHGWYDCVWVFAIVGSWEEAINGLLNGFDTLNNNSK